jgi:hypothetical protein
VVLHPNTHGSLGVKVEEPIPNTLRFRTTKESQGCHTGRPEAFWRANRAGGPVHYALYEPGGVL